MPTDSNGSHNSSKFRKLQVYKTCIKFHMLILLSHLKIALFYDAFFLEAALVLTIPTNTAIHARAIARRLAGRIEANL